MFELSPLDISRAIIDKKYSAEEVLTAYFEQINRHDGKINAFISLNKEYALKKAREVQKKIDKGEKLSSLAGVPIAVKDNISTKNFTTTCASKMLDGFNPIYNASVIDKLENAGLIITGKLNMDEFGMGSSSETGFYGSVKNPWDLNRVAGGSSGGSAAAIASGEIPLSLGTDTGGSIRQPCSFCGVSGIKPTYGSVSRYGLIAYASSLDQIGPIGNSIEDCAALLEIISGKDDKDSSCILNDPFNFQEKFQNKLEGIKIGLPVNYFENGIEDGVKNAVLSNLNVFKELGAEIIEFTMPYLEYMVPAYYVIASAEASSNLSRYDGIKYGYRSKNAINLGDIYRKSRNEGFGLEVKRRIILGSFVLSSGYFDAYYKKASGVRDMVKSVYNDLFNKFDIILSPVAPSTAYNLGEKINDPLKMYMGDIYTVSVNLAGIPAVSLPCGFDENDLPVGLQLIGSAFSEHILVNIAREFQAETAWHKMRPKGFL